MNFLLLGTVSSLAKSSCGPLCATRAGLLAAVVAGGGLGGGGGSGGGGAGAQASESVATLDSSW